MKWFKREASTAEINHEVLTRLGCRELETIQHDVRNAMSGIYAERKKAFKAVRELMDALGKMLDHMERIEAALAAKGKSK